jgi:hypothetical protein
MRTLCRYCRKPLSRACTECWACMRLHERDTRRDATRHLAEQPEGSR